MLEGVLNAVLVREKVIAVTSLEEFINVIPVGTSDSALVPVFTIMLPNTNSSQSLFDNFRTGNAVIKVIIRIRGTIPSIIGTKVEANIGPV